MIEQLSKFELPGTVCFESGNGGLPKVLVQTPWSTAEVYLHGAQVTGFQKTDEPPLLFVSRLSQFATGKPIRGGIPICFPWFGPRTGNVSHGFARIVDWIIIETVALPSGGVSLCFQLPDTSARQGWPAFLAEYRVTVTDRLTLEMAVINQSKDQDFTFAQCLHTYFAVGDIQQVAITGLKAHTYLDDADEGVRKVDSDDSLQVNSRIDRAYLDATGPVEIHDTQLRRIITIEKTGSASTVVWNPWTTQTMADLGSEEFQRMICVESGNIGPNRCRLAPSETNQMQVVMSSRKMD